MKTPVIVAAVLFTASHVYAASTGITLRQSTVPKPATPKVVAPEDTPAAPADKTPADKAPADKAVVDKAPVKKLEEAKPKAEEAKPKPAAAAELVIPGTTLARPNGGFLGFEVVGGQLKISFYDKKKKPMAADVTHGVARWPDPRGIGQVRTPLNPSGTVLMGVKPALPPFNYTITIQFLAGEGEDAAVVESYSVPFRG